MFVGIKYCGGCNSRYDRVSLVNGLKSKYSSHTYEYAEENIKYDVLLLINGCPSACTNISEYIYDQLINISDIQDLDAAEKILNNKDFT